MSNSEYRYLVVSVGKSGCNWLNNMLAGLPGIKHFPMAERGVSGVRIEELDILQPGHTMFCHLNLTQCPELIGRIEALRIRAFYIYRDLRDALVSEYYHKSAKEPERFADVMRGVTPANAFNLDKIRQWSTVLPFYPEIGNWLAQSKIPVCRFEDMVANPASELRRILAHHGMPCTEAEVNAAVAFGSFERMSGGRKPGQEDSTHHYRKGIVGDWRNHFTPRQVNALERAYGDILTRVGYPADRLSDRVNRRLRSWLPAFRITPAPSHPKHR